MYKNDDLDITLAARFCYDGSCSHVKHFLGYSYTVHQYVKCEK